MKKKLTYQFFPIIRFFNIKTFKTHLTVTKTNFSIFSGKKLPIVIFNCQALSQPQPLAAGQKYHLTFKTVNADAKLISQICHAHGFHEVHASNSDYNLMWTGVSIIKHSVELREIHSHL